MKSIAILIGGLIVGLIHFMFYLFEIIKNYFKKL